MTELVVNAKQLDHILMNVPPHIAVFIWGPPGVGKSDVVRQVGAKKGIPVIDVRLTLLDPTDLRGLPFIRDGEAIWARPVFIPKEEIHGKEGILLFDEMNAAMPAVQAAAYQITLDRRIGEHKIPDGWRVWCAGNREGDRAVTYRLPTPLVSRLMHVELTPDYEAWKEWAYGKIDDAVIGFLGYRQELLFKFDPNKASRAFPCPRTWQRASELLGAFRDDDTHILRTVLSGVIGEGPCIEFIGYLKVVDKIPNPLDIIEKGKILVPSEPGSLYALCTCLVSWTLNRKGTELSDGMEAILTYSHHLPKEFAVMMIKDISLRHKASMVKAKAWTKWCEKFRGVIV